MRIGLIADPHGFLGDDARRELAGCERILHAGDVGEGVLQPLAAIAPLTAVRGNNDTEGEASLLPEAAFIELGGLRIALVHRLVDAPRPPWDVLVFGHCHKQHAYEQQGRLWVNPGAAGRRGFHRSRSVALLELAGARPEVTFIDLGLRSAARPGRGDRTSELVR
jgi:putative phosphoesterase